MKICSKCGHALSDEESSCPYCFAEHLDKSSNESDALLSAVLYSPTEEIESGDIEAALEAVDTELSDNYDFPEPPEEQPEDEAPKQAAQSPEGKAAEDPAGESSPQRKGFRESSQGELEARVRDFVKLDGARDESVVASKLGISLVVMIVAAVLVFAVVCLVRYMRAPEATDSQLLLEYISGRWLSEPFTYAD
ncbi:MAG: hypothetical protein Q4B42_08005, partial [Oscillospiraceae bacterium]|nr:hypothetical protein [Oscillospiraceae bacterium]